MLHACNVLEELFNGKLAGMPHELQPPYNGAGGRRKRKTEGPVQPENKKHRADEEQGKAMAASSGHINSLGSSYNPLQPENPSPTRPSPISPSHPRPSESEEAPATYTPSTTAPISTQPDTATASKAELTRELQHCVGIIDGYTRNQVRTRDFHILVCEQPEILNAVK
jgi:hypothetical protein